MLSFNTQEPVMTNAFRLICVGMAVVTCNVAILRADTQADWPQWRGPDRCGICSDKTALAESWPAAGLHPLWLSAEIPSGMLGGYGSPIVADGNVILYVNEKYSVPVETRLLPGDCLRSLGWLPADKLPPEPLLKAVEDARLSDERDKLKSPRDVNSWTDQWLKDHLTDAQRTNFSAYCGDRLRKGRSVLAVEEVNRLIPLKDKKFATQAEFDQAMDDNAVTGAVRQAAIKGVVGTQDIGKDVVYCLSAVDGKTVWRKEYDNIPGTKNLLNASSSTPCVAAGKVIVSGADGGLYCLSAKDGSEQWAVKVGKGNLNGSPLVFGDLVIITGLGATYAVHLSDGTTAWKQSKGGGYNSPVVWSVGDKKYLLCNTGNRVFCLDPLTGASLWDTPGGHSSTVAVSGDVMAVQAGNTDPEPGLTAYRIAPAHAEKLWSVKVFDRGSSPITFNGCVYSVAEGQAICVSIADGHIAWNEKIGNSSCASPVLADGKLFALVENGAKLVMLRASPEKFEPLAKANVATLTCSSPAIANGRLYVRQEKCVACYDLTVSTLPPPVTGSLGTK